MPGIRLLGLEYKYRKAAVLALSCRLSGLPHYVLTLRGAKIPQGGEFSFPGGKFEAGVDLGTMDTAIRESAEELGVSPDRISGVAYFGTLISASGKYVDVYTGDLELGSPADLSPNADEVEKVCFLSRQALRESPYALHEVETRIYALASDEAGARVLLPSEELGLPEKYYRDWPGQRCPIHVYRTPFGVVWGITAEILFELEGPGS